MEKMKALAYLLLIIAGCLVCSYFSLLKKENDDNFQQYLDEHVNKPTSKTEKQLIQKLHRSTREDDNRIMPTQKEIDEVNNKLPILVSEGTLLTRVDYQPKTKVQTFYYNYTQVVEESMIAPVRICELKNNMVEAIRIDSSNVERMKAGLILHYVYRSIDKKVLYEITIDKTDLD